MLKGKTLFALALATALIAGCAKPDLSSRSAFTPLGVPAAP